MNEKITYHTQIINNLSEEINVLEEKKNDFLVFRFVCLILGVIGCFLTWSISLYAVLGVINIAIIAFVSISYNETKLNNTVTFLIKRKEVFTLEIKLLNRDFKGLDEGKEFIISNHNYAHDLDIFGFKSLFQFLNRTSTFKGKQLLGKWLNSPLTNPEKIVKKQKAIQELKEKEEWCYKLLAHGKSSNDKAETQESIDNWLNDKVVFDHVIIKVGRLLLPLITISIGILSYLNILGNNIFLFAFLTQLAISAKYSSQVSKIQRKLGSRFAIIENYIKIVSAIESENFSSENLKKIQRKFINKENNFSVTQTLNRLKKLLDKLDARLNIYLAIVLNGLFLWDINVAYQIEQWKIKNKSNLNDWMNNIGEVDALISLALFAANHPNYTYPSISNNKKELNFVKVGHPLISPAQLVKNSYSLTGNGKVDLLTGANMAGKSTFLRTVGINLILARIGAPVCADKFTFTPFKLFSSLRTVDSLKDNESFFYAELKRLKQLIDLYKKGEEFFFLWTKF